MFPSWDSLSELERWQETLGRVSFWVPIGFGFLCLMAAAAWGIYNSKVDERVTFLRSKEQEATKKAESDERAAIKQQLDGIPLSRGVLYPGQQETPQIEELQRNSGRDLSNSLFIGLGSQLFVADGFPLSALRQDDEDILAIDRTDEGIRISAAFYDRSGDVICRIRDNEFTKIPVSPYFLDPTPKDRPTKLEVRDAKNKLVLVVAYQNKQTVQVAGDFYARHGRRIVMNDHFFDPGLGLIEQRISIRNNTLVSGGAGPRVLYIVPDSPPKQRTKEPPAPRTSHPQKKETGSGPKPDSNT